MIHQPLNYVNYNKNEAMKILSQKIGWEYYGGKHYGSNYTKFFDAYWKNYKFSHDPRKGQLSSLISTNQISKKDALLEISKSTYNDYNIKKDIKYICNKLDFTVDELQKLFEGQTNIILITDQNI